jgi:hypothetical protein
VESSSILVALCWVLRSVPIRCTEHIVNELYGLSLPKNQGVVCIRIPGVTGASLDILSTVQMCEEATKEGRKRECGKSPLPPGTMNCYKLLDSYSVCPWYHLIIIILLFSPHIHYCKRNSNISVVEELFSNQILLFPLYLYINSMDLQCMIVMPSKKTHNCAYCRNKKMQFMYLSSLQYKH